MFSTLFTFCLSYEVSCNLLWKMQIFTRTAKSRIFISGLNILFFNILSLSIHFLSYTIWSNIFIDAQKFLFFSHLYYSIFGSRRCTRCLAPISSSELVMRARHLVFHVQCFSCYVCNAHLTKGDQFGLRGSAIYCNLHYEISGDTTTTTGIGGPMQTSMGMTCQYAQYGASPNNGHTSPHNNDTSAIKMSTASGYFVSSTPHSLAGLPQTPRQKGRPRKRKPKDIDAMNTNLGKCFPSCILLIHFYELRIYDAYCTHAIKYEPIL